MTFVIFGYSGFIGKNLVLKLQTECKEYVIIDRNDLNNIENLKIKTKNLKNITVIYLIHDFKNNSNNIILIQKIINYIKKNIIIDKFIYLSSWVTIFNISNYKDDKYTITKKKIEKYLYKINNFPIIIVRPPLVIGKNSQFQPFINILLLTISPYFLHVDELSHQLINIDINNKYYNTPSYKFNNNNFFKKIDCAIARNIIPKSFSFVFCEIKFPVSNNLVSESMITKLIIKNEYDCVWGLKYLTNFKFVAKNQAVKIQKDNNYYQLVSFNEYNKILYFDDNIIRVQSGTTLKLIIEYLITFNKTIKHLPEYDELSAGACVMTHIHGCSFYNDTNSSIVASCIKSITILKKINNDIIKLNILNSDDEFINILFNKNYNNGKFCITEVEFYIINNRTLYKIYDEIKIPSNLKKLHKYLHHLIINNINLTVQYNKDSSNTLCLWKVSDISFNKLNICKPSFILRRHAHSLLRKNILYPYYMEVDTYPNILCQYHSTLIENLIIKISHKMNYPCYIQEFTCSFTNFIYVFKLLLKYNPNSIGIRFSVTCKILKKKYPNLIENDILCWFEIVNNSCIIFENELKNYIYFYHSGKFEL